MYEVDENKTTEKFDESDASMKTKPERICSMMREPDRCQIIVMGKEKTSMYKSSISHKVRRRNWNRKAKKIGQVLQ